MGLLLKLSGEPKIGEANVPVTIASAFRKVRHIIGRLAAHVRTVKEVIEDGHKLDGLLDVFEVAVVPRPPCVARLQADSHTNLSGILGRMLEARDKRLPNFLAYLYDLDQQTALEKSLHDQFDSTKAPPCVHAEVQMLHHFYDNNRRFFADDEYIATSKPACFCCKLYFRHHPASYVEPDSHEKVYANWGPICLPEIPRSRNDRAWIEHRKLMNSVINDIRKEVHNEIERRSKSPLYHEHQDTLTGLTTSSHTFGDDTSDSQSEAWADGNGFYESETNSDSEGGATL